MAPEWRIYYSDGTTFDSAMGGPWDAPADGMLGVMMPDTDANVRLMHKWDWYFWHSECEEWWGCDIYGLIDHIKNNPHAVAVKQGRNVDNTTWQEFMKTALNDPDFPERSGKRDSDTPVTHNERTSG